MVEQYLRTCVTAYAAVLDGIDPGDVPASSDHAAAGGDGPLHGSIAFSQDDDGAYAWGIAWSFDSAAGAQSEALGQCREYGGTRCAQAGWFQEACGALAIGSGNGYGAGWGATVAEAERDALAQCRARLNDDCRIEVARCSQSEEAGGSGQLDREDTAVSRDTAGTADASCGAWEATYTVVWKEEGLRRGGQNFSDAAWGETKAEAEDSGQNQCIFYGGGNGAFFWSPALSAKRSACSRNKRRHARILSSNRHRRTAYGLRMSGFTHRRKACLPQAEGQHSPQPLSMRQTTVKLFFGG